MYVPSYTAWACRLWLSDGGADGDIITRAAEPTLNDDNGGNETFAYVIQFWSTYTASLFAAASAYIV